MANIELPEELSNHRKNNVEQSGVFTMDTLYLFNSDWNVIRIPYQAYKNLEDIKKVIAKHCREQNATQAVYTFFHPKINLDIWISAAKKKDVNIFGCALVHGTPLPILDIPAFDDETVLFREILFQQAILEDKQQATVLKQEFASKYPQSALTPQLDQL